MTVKVKFATFVSRREGGRGGRRGDSQRSGPFFLHASFTWLIPLSLAPPHLSA